MEIKASSNTPAMSSDITSLAAAFLLAKKEFTATGRSGHNSHTKADYALLKDIYGAVEEHLLKNNIIIWHFERPGDNRSRYIYTRLIHTLTGQFVEDIRLLESEKPGNQDIGKANTYMKKYAVLSLCAIAPSDKEDDDGQGEASHIETKEKSDHLTRQIKGKSSSASIINASQLLSLLQQITSAANSKTLYAKILATEYIQDLSEMQATSFDDVMDYIGKNRE